MNDVQALLLDNEASKEKVEKLIATQVD